MIHYFFVPIFIGFIIQLIKILIDFYKEKKINVQSIRRAGGFPSVHSGISASITTLMLLKFGIDSSEFAIAFTFSFLFWYDSMNVRYEAGKHAKYLNNISHQLKTVFEFGDNKYILLKERLGHTLYEVLAGILFGSIITVILYTIFY
ncbi:divergent PAP2 family protein [Candidatus Vampirococcus lugosii]|uniref:Acid phosphatase n=1 Tax=Candidatus Vampirococcus lugosii TaxID=2789015 RepID=A0ABS5QPF9_9BACT|nr:divergent PAP2 family protein [Candidatus Vampirococcus lugosii]MBS8122436.1 acid phosphatase [Candidatus Vampirococcus lugosii]